MIKQASWIPPDIVLPKKYAFSNGFNSEGDCRFAKKKWFRAALIDDRKYHTIVRKAMKTSNLTIEEVEYQIKTVSRTLAPILFNKKLFDFDAFSRIFLLYSKWDAQIRKSKKIKFLGENLDALLADKFHQNWLEKALMITKDTEKICSWLELGFLCEANEKLDEDFQTVLEKYEIKNSENKAGLYLSYWNNPNWETDYCVAIRKPVKDPSLFNNYGIIATAGFRVVESDVAIIEKIQGIKAGLFESPMPELIGLRWEFSLVEVLEILAKQYGIETLLIRPGEYNPFRYRAASDLKRRMNGTAKKMRYKKISISNGDKAYVKSLSDKPVPDFSNFSFPILRDSEYDNKNLIKMRWD